MGFINQFPYTDFHELNLDWVIKKTKEIQNEILELQKVVADIQVMTEEQIRALINNAISVNNIEVYNRLSQQYQQITSEYKSYVDTNIRQLTAYVDNQDAYYDQAAQTYAENAYINAKNYVDTSLLDYTMMINPITGEYQDVRIVVDDIIYYFHSDSSLTAQEYDTLELTAADYDAYDLTAYDYDFNGKTILNP